MDENCGEFCRLFGNNPRNVIIEFFLEMRSMDFSIGDIANETGLNRATAYNTIAILEKESFIMKTRKVSGSQMYKLNNKLPEVNLLIKVFDKILIGLKDKYYEKILA